MGIVCLLFSVSAVAQKAITGQMLDAQTGEPLIGANVLVKGTTSGTVTDFDGTYQINAEEGDVLVFSYTGYSPKEIVVGPEDTYNVRLESGQVLDEVVVVAYGKQKKVTITGAVTALEGEELIASPAVDISNSLAGRLPGVVIRQPSAEPGFDGAIIRIRGSNTLGNSSPLVVIDGVPDRAGGLGRLAPQDIASISVLKDASAAIYGARAANGVILVTTKRGSTGKPTITYDFNQGFSQPTVIPQMADAGTYARMVNEQQIFNSIPASEWGDAWQSVQNSGSYTSPTPGVGTINSTYGPEAIRMHESGSDPWAFPDTDWFDDSFKTWAPQSRHNLQINGGTESVRYLASLGFIDQDAYYENSATRYKQYNFRVNLDADVSDYITTSLGIMARREDRNFPTASAGTIFRMLMRGRPTEPQVWPNGLPGPAIENGENPYVITTNATGYQNNPTDFIQANGSIDISNPWVEGLRLTLSGAVDQTTNRNTVWQTPWTLYTWDGVSRGADGNPLLEGNVASNFSDPRLREETGTILNTNLTAILNYERSFGGGHAINLLAGVTRETFQGQNYFAFRRNYISSAVDQLFAGGNLQQNTGGSGYDRARLGYYGRAQYNFKEKYLAEFIWRYDGSYIFPEADRFGFFPGLLLGWNVSDEDFFDVGFVDYLKLRTSYGQMGNDQVFFNGQLQEFAYLSTYSFGEYPINSVVETTLQEVVLANPSFTWERANNFNFGLDATLFNNKIDLTLEYFYNKRDQILIQETGSTPASSGISTLLPPVNAGRVDNRGFEFDIGYNGNAASGLRYRFGVNGGYARNKVVFMDEIPGAPEYQFQEGKPIGAFLVYEYDGVFFDQSEIDANTLDYSAVTGQLRPGDMKFRDVNGDGAINGDDLIRLDRNIIPDFNFGINLSMQYQNFDLTVLLQGATGAMFQILQEETGEFGNYLQYTADNRWSIDNPSSVHPRPFSRRDTYYSNPNYGRNTYYLFSKDYIRLKNLELGYTLPQSLVSRFNIGSLRAYANGLNLLTFADQDIFDPEAENNQGYVYPQARIINLGLSITF